MLDLHFLDLVGVVLSFVRSKVDVFPEGSVFDFGIIAVFGVLSGSKLNSLFSTCDIRLIS